MKVCGNWPIGVCSWSLDNNAKLLGEIKSLTGIDRIHLALGPAIDGVEGYIDNILNAGWIISAAMVGFANEDYSTLETIRRTGGIVPDDCWPENKKLLQKAIKLTAQLKVKFLEFHFGFIEMSDSAYARKLLDRAKTAADMAGENGVQILFETGQETAETLKRFIESLNHRSVAINFDPGNMILYGKGRPLQAVEMLSQWIKHVHIKDALPSDSPGKWGREMAWGCGQVGGDKFLRKLKSLGFSGAVSIEREAGITRTDDIKSAVEKLSAFNG